MSSLLTAANLTFSFGERPALRGVDLTLAPGELVALVGPNGSGKSTLIQCLLGHLRATGTIQWFDQPLAQLSRRQLARRVAYLPQAPSFDAGQRVVDVLRLGRAPYWSAFGIESAEDERIVRAVADQLDLRSLLGRPIDELSGGQRQRVFVGRCLVQQPAALLLDEPNTYLDLKHGVELCELLRRLAAEQSLGVLMAVHDLNLAARFADRVVVMSEGTVAAAGGVDVLEPELLTRVYGLPMIRLSGPNNRPVLIAGLNGGGSVG